MDMKTIGKWALIIGIVLALANALFGGDDGLLEADTAHLVSAVLGLVAGFLFLSADDATGYYILTAAVGAVGGTLGMGDAFLGVGHFVTVWMAGSAVVLGAGAIALILRTFYSWVMP